jgi:hypothetical protein
MNAFTFGDQAFLARAGTDYHPLYPALIPGATLLRWFDAETYLPAKVNNDQLLPADTWFDKSSNAVPAIPLPGVDATTRPVFKTNVYSTGLPGVELKTQGLFNLNSTLTNGSLTYVVVSKNATGQFHTLGRNGASEEGLFLVSDNHLRFHPQPGGYAESGVTAVTIASARAIAIIRTAGGTSRFKSNLTAHADVNGSAGATNSVLDRLGPGNGAPCNSPQIGCFLLYSTALSDADYTGLYNNYLKLRFGLP